MKFAILIAALTIAAPAGAASNDCLFDGACGRPAAAATVDAVAAPEPKQVPEPAFALKRWEGAKKGAQEGALFGFFLPLSPAISLVDEGFGRRYSRSADGPRAGNDNGALYYYGGIALAVLLYVPALVIGAVGGAVGTAAGAIAPESAKSWDAERFFVD